MSRFLIVNADDFGLSEGTNRGIIEAHERGIVTSASLMVRQPAAEAAADYARAHPQLAVGLHIDLGEWEWREEAWVSIYETVCSEDPSAVATEVERQLAQFHSLMGRMPTHLDSHQHIHRYEPALSAATTAAARLGLPLRGISGGIACCGHFYGHGPKAMPFPDGISVEALLTILRGLPAGTTELCCHPGLDESLPSCYCRERLTEVQTLCDERIRVALAMEKITLTGFTPIPFG